ncbi:MAG: response regulator [Deltaproteobacteria bacterium]|nr:response regulator [Deltaproteobacteria bacterium]
MREDLYRYFRVEARELLEQLGAGVLRLEQRPPREGVPQLLRFAHTLKGAARVVRQGGIAELAHALEEALVSHRDAEAPLGREAVDVLLAILDRLAAQLAALEATKGSASAELAIAPSAPFRAVRVDLEELDTLLGSLAEASVQLRALRGEVARLERARQLGRLAVEQLARGGRNGGGAPSSSEALVARTRPLLDELVAGLAETGPACGEGLHRLERELRDAWDGAERLRLLPAGATFAALERATRDAAHAQGKRVALETRGGETRLDAHVLGVVQSALVQLVRNAVVHGIEVPGRRVAAGKSPEGRVELRVLRRGHRVAFVCQDDGGGVNLDALRDEVRTRGVPPEEAQALGPDELLQLLLKGGLTTSASVSELAGRGLGVDVIRDAAARLGGIVSVRTHAGLGTTVELVVPVTLSSQDVLVVEAASQQVAVPLEAVRELRRLGRGELADGPDGPTTAHDGRTIPFVSLAGLLGAPSVRPQHGEARLALILAASGARLALGIDRLVGPSDVVVRPLPPLTPADPVVAGVWIDAEGTPQLVLDPQGILRAGRRREEPAAAPVAPPPILVVDDSLTTRMLEQSILEAAGYEVDLATSGEEALQRLRRRSYGLCLVDVEMPGMDGFALVERLRDDPAFRGIPAILVTSRDAPEDRERGEAAGARAYMVKSEFDQGRLLATIRSLIGS